MNRLFLLLISFLALFPLSLRALDLPRSAENTYQNERQLGRYQAPFGPYTQDGIVFFDLEGRIQRTAWQLDNAGISTLQVLDPLRAQLLEKGYDIALDCDQDSCGGFDFRFAIDVIPAPEMFVNIREYQFLTAYLGPKSAPERLITILVSTSKTAAYVQIIQAIDSDAKPLTMSSHAPVNHATGTRSNGQPQSLETELLTNGYTVLQGVEFATGTTELNPKATRTLEALARFFKAHDEVTLILVGHTDSVGSLERNIALSKQRAQAVREVLITSYQLDPARIFAQGNGYLAPLASNFTAEGRKTNRRVEAIIIPR